MTEHLDTTLTFFDPDIFFDIPPKSSRRYRILSHSPREFADILRTPVPHAAEVSATVARNWHLGLAEDAERRGKPWHVAATFMALRGRPSEHAEAMADYFDGLEGDHRQAAEKVTR